MSNRYSAIARWIWIAAILLALVAVVARNLDEVAATLSELALNLLLASIVLNILSKFLLGENARCAARQSNLELSYFTALRLYSLSQLGKYLPGSIWQFVGRAVAYRHRGANYGQISNALLAENIWTVGSAAIFGLTILGPSAYPLLSDGIDRDVLVWLSAASITLLALFLTLALRSRRLVLDHLRTIKPTLSVLLTQLAIWTLLGFAFWSVAAACRVETDPLYAAGLFAIAYAVGFAVPFAPAGLGVREALLTVGLLPFTSAGEAFTVTLVSRASYLTVELLLVGGLEAIQLRIARTEENLNHPTD